jgi:hypothetical protein
MASAAVAVLLAEMALVVVVYQHRLALGRLAAVVALISYQVQVQHKEVACLCLQDSLLLPVAAR